jgi:opacity protein-like surface antigen
MRRFTSTLLATTAAICLAASVASAADLPRKAPAYQPPPPPPLWNWTGFYVGGNLGAGWSRQQFGNEDSDFGSSNNTNTGFGGQNGVGPTGGFQVGYNWQFPNSPIVVGLEGMFNFASIKGNGNNSTSSADTFATGDGDTLHFVNTSFNSQFSSKVKDIALLTARLGLTSGPQDRTLWYIKGGGAWAKTNYTLNARTRVDETVIDTADINAIDSVTTTTSFASAQVTRSRWGWTVGTGVEFGLWDNWSTRIEYDYLNFSNSNISDGGRFTNFCNNTGNCGAKQEIHLVTIGLNYRFNWGKAPTAY